MSLGPLTCDKHRDRDLQDGRSRESIRCKYLHPSPPSKRDEEGGGNKRRRVSIKTPEGESFTPASESIVRGTVTPDACVGIIACGVFAGCFCVRAKHQGPRNLRLHLREATCLPRGLRLAIGRDIVFASRVFFRRRSCR